MDSLVTWSPAARSALQLPPHCHTISAGCRSLPELLHCFIHWVTGKSSHPDHSTEEVREKQFHRTFLGCFSNFIWLLMSLKLPREGAVFWVYFLFHLQILSILTTDPGYQKVSEAFIQNEQAHGMGLFGTQKAVPSALVEGLAGGSLFLAAAVLASLCPIFMAPEPQFPQRLPSCCTALTPQEMQAQEIRWVHGSVTWTLLCGHISASTVLQTVLTGKF